MEITPDQPMKPELQVQTTEIENAADVVSVSGSARDRTSLSPELRVAATVLLSAVIVFTSVGNLLTIIVMRCDRRLRSKPASSMYIASLACADLLVGTIVMTLMMLYTVTFNGRWMFGRVVCTVWTCVDYISCTASLINVCLIAIDRYKSVSQPLKSIRRRNKRTTVWSVVAAWLTPTIFWMTVVCVIKSRQIDREDKALITKSLAAKNHAIWWPNISITAVYDDVIDQHQNAVKMTSPVYDARSALMTTCDTDWKPPEVIIVSVVVMFYVPLAAIFILFGLIICVLHRHMTAFNVRMRATTGSFGTEQSTSDQITSAAMATATTDGGNMIRDSAEHQSRNCDNSFGLQRSQPEQVFANDGGDFGRKSSSMSAAALRQEVVVADVVVVRRDVSSGVSPTRSRVCCDRHESSPLSSRLSRDDDSASSGGGVTDLQRTCQQNRHRRSTRADTDQPRHQVGQGNRLIHDCIRLMPLSVDMYSTRPPSSGQLEEDMQCWSSPNVNAVIVAVDSNGIDVCTADQRGCRDTTDSMPKWRRYANQLRARRHDEMQQTRLRRQVKAARTLGAITGVLLVCWLPFTLMLAMRAFCPSCLDQRTFDVAVWINYINSAANPVIYGLCNSQYRLAMRTLARRTLRVCCRCKLWRRSRASFNVNVRYESRRQH